jgi:UDP:flavonoid glycosyltransferase YjiC (YdhE family)
LYHVSRLLISRFDECWIPDYIESPGLSGDLSHKYPLPKNAKFIGPLSRFKKQENISESISGEGNITAIISGPEPQRSIFEDTLKKQLAGLNQNAIIISGKPESEEIPVVDGKLTILPHLSVKEMSSLIDSSSLVICRSGYSSIMDLQAMGAKALFVPTPGQTEQIYLAELHQKSGTALWQAQENMNLKVGIEQVLRYNGFGKYKPGSGLSEAIADLKKK